jgi:hypothetical protein
MGVILYYFTDFLVPTSQMLICACKKKIYKRRLRIEPEGPVGAVLKPNKGKALLF